ncbi:hypothetical protein MNBD_NITROSPINAE02-1859 [hydrothermal vent metagenome]|uniref:Inner membrane protein YjeT (Clustered with HflC) n=1 Tax=hydrothermal vent metagenome TaxID=652676 RepID=A0A3B1BWR3_9ZZZZ
MVIGIVMIIEGIPYFAMPNRVKEVAALIVDAEKRTLGMIGFALMTGGLAIVALTGM